MSYSSLAELVRSYETGGISDPWTAKNYRYDATHTASGGYQITNTLWRSFAPSAGVDLAQYPAAYTAPESAQTSVFSAIVGRNGLRDWTCPGCNPALSSYLAAHPDAAGLPVTAGGTSGGAASTPTAGAVGGTGGAASTGASFTPSGWLDAITARLSGGAARVGLGLLGVLLIGGALLIFAKRA